MRTLDQHPRRLPVLIVGFVVLLFGVGFWLLRNDSDSTEPDTGDTPSISHEIPATSPSDGVKLPEGRDTVDGYPIGFPDSDLGAVSTQVAIARAQVGFDYDQAAQVADIYAAPEAQEVVEDRSRAAVALRREQAGVPAEGEVPAPASYALTPIAFSVEELPSGRWAVTLLSYVSLTHTDGSAKDFLYSGTQVFDWIDGDWKVVQASQDDLDHLIAMGQPSAVAPGTPEYEGADWITIRGDVQ